MIPINNKIQHIKITLLDGKVGWFSGPPLFDDFGTTDYIGVKSIEFTAPKPLPAGHYFEWESK